jgi:hypothetical protein
MINFCRSGHNDFPRYPLFPLAEEMFFRFRARNRKEEMQSGLFGSRY